MSKIKSATQTRRQGEILHKIIALADDACRPASGEVSNVAGNYEKSDRIAGIITNEISIELGWPHPRVASQASETGNSN